MSVENTIQHLYLLHHRGKKNAITREEFQRRYDYLLGGIDDREFRDIYSRLPIVTGPRGGYWPASGDEVLMFVNEMNMRREALQKRKCMVLEAHRALIRDPELETRAKQKELPL